VPVTTFTTPTPQYLSGSVIPSNPPRKFSETDRLKLRSTAARARTVFPGPIGEFLFYEINAWADFAFRFGDRGQMAGLVAQINSTPIPKPPENLTGRGSNPMAAPPH
jgi:hypothetical protein